MSIQHRATFEKLKARNPAAWQVMTDKIFKAQDATDQRANKTSGFAETKHLSIVEELTSSFSKMIKEELLPNFQTLNLFYDFHELRNLGEELIIAAGEQEPNEPFAQVAEYFQRVNLILQDADLDPDTSRKVWAISSKCVADALSIVSGHANFNVIPQNDDAYRDLLQGATWQEHFKKNLPPKYEGVKKDGKALKFFLEWYRGKTSEHFNHNNNRLDYVTLGLMQADMRHYDPKLLRALINADQYKTGIELNKILPPVFTKTYTDRHI